MLEYALKTSLKPNTRLLNQVLDSKEMLNTIKNIWPVIKNGEPASFKIIFCSQKTLEILKTAESIIREEEEISLERLMSISKMKHEDLDSTALTQSTATLFTKPLKTSDSMAATPTKLSIK